MEPESTEQSLGKGYKYLAMGLRLAGGIVVFMFGGLLLDRWLHTTPLFVLVGTLGGAALGFVSVYRELVADPENRPTYPKSDRRKGKPGGQRGRGRGRGDGAA